MFAVYRKRDQLAIVHVAGDSEKLSRCLPQYVCFISNIDGVRILLLWSLFCVGISIVVRQ